MDDRKLLDHHLDGLVLLYFSREMEGSIVETRSRIHEQVGMGHLIKSMNFLGDYDNNVTEICIPSKFARWFIAQVGKVRNEDRVLGDPYPMDCNPLTPRWDDMDEMSPEVCRKRAPRHIKKIMDQWYSCAKRSQSQAIREFYSQLLVRVAASTGRHLWCNMVQDIKVDASMDTFPKVVALDPPDNGQDTQRNNKRRVSERAMNTPISAMRKKKGRKKGQDKDGMCDDDGYNSSASDEETETVNKHAEAAVSGQQQRQTQALRQTVYSGDGANAANIQGGPAGPVDTNDKNGTERVDNGNVVGNEENVPP